MYDAQSNLKSAKVTFRTPARNNKLQMDFMSTLAEAQKSLVKALKLDPIVPALEEKIAELTALKGSGDGSTKLEVMDALVLFLDIACRVDNQATLEGSRDELVSSSSKCVKLEL